MKREAPRNSPGSSFINTRHRSPTGLFCRFPRSATADRFRYLTACVAALIIILIPQSGTTEVVDRVVAVVNDSVITLSELNVATAVVVRGLKGEPTEVENIVETKSKILDSLIEKKLMKQAADSAGIEVSEKEIDLAIEDIIERNAMTEENLMTELARNGLTYKEYREQLREDIRQVKFVSRQFSSQITIEDEDMEDYYKRNMESFRDQDSFWLRLIFLARGDEKATRMRLDAVMEELKNGVDFEKVASQYSDGPAASEGGDLGYVMAGELASAIEGAARQLKPGEVSGPVFTKEGVNIIQLMDRHDGEPQPFEEVKEEIRDKLFKEKMGARYDLWLEDMKRYAHIEVRL